MTAPHIVDPASLLGQALDDTKDEVVAFAASGVHSSGMLDLAIHHRFSLRYYNT